MSEGINLGDPSTWPESIHEVRRRRLAELEQEQAGMILFLSAVIKKYGEEHEDPLGQKRRSITLTDADLEGAPGEIAKENYLTGESGPGIRVWVRA